MTTETERAQLEALEHIVRKLTELVHIHQKALDAQCEMLDLLRRSTASTIAINQRFQEHIDKE